MTDRSLTLGVRPEDLSVASESSEHTLTTTVSVVEPVGDRTHVYFDLSGQTYSASLSHEPDVTEGNQIELTMAEESLHFFHPESGKAVDYIRTRKAPVG